MGFIEFLAWITDNVGFICCIFLFVFSLICLSFHEQTPEIKFTIHLMDDNKLELFCRRNLRGKTCLTAKTLEFWRQWVQSIYLRDIARTLANIYNEDFFKNSSQLLAINYCCKPSHPRYFWGSSLCLSMLSVKCSSTKIYQFWGKFHHTNILRNKSINQGKHLTALLLAFL